MASNTFYCSGSSSYPTKVEATSSVNNSYSNTQAKITITVTAQFTINTWTSSSGLMCECSCNGELKPQQGYNSLHGNGGGTTKYYQSTISTVTYEFIVNKTRSAQSISWSVNIHGSKDMVDTGYQGSLTGSQSVSAKPSYSIIYNGNGHTGGSTSNQTKYYNENITLRSNGYTKTHHSFTGWNTQANGTGTAYSAGATYSNNSPLSLYAQWRVDYTKCGIPTNLSITDNGDNTFTVTGTVGSSGTQNAAAGIKIFGVYNGTKSTPSTSSYDFTFTLKGTTGTKLSTTYGPIMMNSLSGEYNPTIKIVAYTIGAVSGYDSDLSSVVSGNFKYYTKPSSPIILRPSIDMTHAPHDFTVLWEKPDDGINNPVTGYNLVMQQLEEPFDVYSFDFLSDPDILGCTVKTNKLDINHTYQFKLQALGTNPNFNSDIVTSSTLNIIELEPFSDLVFTPSSLDDIKFFENGDNYTNVLHISDDVLRQLLLIKWNAPEGINNIVKVFNAYLIDEDNNQLQYWQSPSNNRGFAISSEHISKDSIESLYKEYRLKIDTLSIYSDEYQNYDNTSEFLFRVYPASGMYIKTKYGFKRAIGFKKLDDGSWIPLRELYHRTDNNESVKSDINIPSFMNNGIALIRMKSY